MRKYQKPKIKKKHINIRLYNQNQPNLFDSFDSLNIDGNLLAVCGNCCSGSQACCSSDMRLKKNITQLQNILDKLKRIRGVSFNWKRTIKGLGIDSRKKQIGLLAQEVEKEFPELVVKVNEIGYKGIDYSKFSAILVEAMKELSNENLQLKDRIIRLENALA